jgi:hypothetical protein
MDSFVRLAAVVLALLVGCGHEDGTEGTPGPQGEQGPAGPQGPVGPPGQVTVLDGGVIEGPPGPQGPEGPAGPMGATGAMGAMGAMGATGPMGPMGTSGATGAQGPAGPAGAQGAQGVAGAQGPGGSIYGEEAAAFAGFTATPITGGPGGRDKMHAACAAAFSGSHLCHASEYDDAAPATQPPASGAWIDESGSIDTGDSEVDVVGILAGPNVGRYVGQLDTGNCENWTAASSGVSGATIATNGITTAQCNTTHVVACCSTPFREKFAGFTPTSSTGVAGGRYAMHTLCGTAFPGSHLCHVSEFYRTQTATTPPAGGAWIDESGYPANEIYVNAVLAARDIGRYTGQLDTGNCQNWSTATSGAIVTASGISTATCTTSLPLACCK